VVNAKNYQMKHGMQVGISGAPNVVIKYFSKPDSQLPALLSLYK